MRINKFGEATEFIHGLMKEKDASGSRLLAAGMVKLDSVPAWSGTSEHKMDGTEYEIIYLAYEEATQEQIDEAIPARIAGVPLEKFIGRIIDMRRVGKDKDTIQVLFSTGLRTKPFRSINVDKGCLCAISLKEGVGVTVEEATASVPDGVLAKLKAAKPFKDRSRRDFDGTKDPIGEGDPIAAYQKDLAGRRPGVRKKLAAMKAVGQTK